MPSIHTWKKYLDKRFSAGEKIPQVIKRCPQCQNLSLTYDPESGKIMCSRCGFEENLQRMGDE